jgi:long-chain acyl-CoA synthetase
LLIEPSDEIKKKIELNPSVFNKLFSFAFSKVLFIIFRLSCKLKVEGTQFIPREGNFIFCANHASYLDGLVVAAAAPSYVLPNIYFIGWKQIFEHPSLKWANKICRLVPIDSSAELMNTMQIAGFLLRNKKSICIFPEGQRTIDGKIQEFRKGIGILVKESGATVIPLAIKGTFEAWPRTRGFPKTYPITVVFGKPITPLEPLSRMSKGAKQNDYELITDYLKVEVTKLFSENA